MARGKYLTPDFPIEPTTVWKAINVHAAPVEIQALLSGAITELYQHWAFDKFGDMTPHETAEYFLGRPFLDDLCMAIADCITSGALDDALAAYLGENGYYPNDPSYSQDDPNTIVPSNTDNMADASKCDDDQLFGQATQLTDYMHDLIQDFFDVVDLAGDENAFLSSVADKVPIIGNYLKTANEALAWFFEFANNYWEAGYTTTLRDEIRCAFFCAMKDDCTLTFDEIVAICTANGAPTITGATIATILDDIIAIVDGETLVWAMYGLLAGIINTGGNWLGVNNVIALATALELGANDPDSDWTILCTECPDINCELPIFDDFETGSPLPCGVIDEGQVQSAFALGTYALAYTTTQSFSDPTIVYELDTAVTGTIIVAADVGWLAALSPRDITYIVRAFDASMNMLDESSQLRPLSSGQWIASSLNLTSATPVKFVEVKASSLTGATEQTVALDNISISQ